MAVPAPDVTAVVDYTIDKTVMDRIPLALTGFALGLGFVLNTEDRNGTAALFAVVYIALLGLAFAGWATTKKIDGTRSFLVSLLIGLAIFIAVALVILFVTGRTGRSIPHGSMLWSGLLDPPPNVFDWMMIYLGIGYIAYAVCRHVRPGRPIIRLTPAGVSFHRPWLADVEIPWSELHAVGPLDTSDIGSPSQLYPHAVAVTVSMAFYDRAIAPKRSALSPPGSEAMFHQRGDAVQFVLSTPDIAVTSQELSAPIAARWTAFRGQRSAVPPTSVISSAPLVYGRWTWTGSWWQIVTFATPLVLLATVVLHALGLIRL